ncbi:hypothetical protein B0H14DRAFT_2634122 [Mycena olivaceomarginata]|nr:hypothetical protein B0H14DRAFT_2634122 [Mycena olivaceomarginata]
MAATARTRMGPGPFGTGTNQPNMRQTRLEEVVGSGSLSAVEPEQSQVMGENSLERGRGDVGEERGAEEVARGTIKEDVDEEAGFRVIEAQLAKQRANREKRKEARERGGDMANMVFSDDGERRPGTSMVARGLPPLSDNDNDLPATIEVPSTTRGEPVDEQQ